MLPWDCHVHTAVLFIYLWLCWVSIAVCGLSLVAESGGYSLAGVHGFLIEVASLLGSMALSTWASVIVAQGLISCDSPALEPCSLQKACRTFLDQGLSPRLLHWQVDSYPLDMDCMYTTREVPGMLSYFTLNSRFQDIFHWVCALSLSVQFSSVAQSYPTLCNPMNRRTPGLPVHHQLPEFTQTHVRRVSDAI